MITASDAWVAEHEKYILPETFIEISYGATDLEAQKAAVPSGTNEAVISTVENITKTTAARRYATLEQNLWLLNGTRTTIPESAAPANIGYVSQSTDDGSVSLSFPELVTSVVPGMTITWSSEYDEYPKWFKVTAKKGSTVIGSTIVEDNRDVTSIVDFDLSEYDGITIEFRDWSLPNHRPRLDSVIIGQGITFTKSDLFSFKHEQSGDLNSGVLPKSSITFSLDNSDGRWNPDNPQGMERYLSERQEIVVKYGMRVGDSVEWIKAGTFYLSEWSASVQTMEATFVARDVFEYLLNEPFPSDMTGDLKMLVETALGAADLPAVPTLHVSDKLANYSAYAETASTAAEVIQMCANATGCVVWQDRNGDLHVEPLDTTDSGYVITRNMSYSHPEVVLSKPLRRISVSYGADGEAYVLDVASAGETQTVDNPMITTEEQAAEVAEITREALITRKSVNGEYRADPRLDLYDVVVVESKFGDIYPVVITNITYTYTGALRGAYEGRVLSREVLSL